MIDALLGKLERDADAEIARVASEGRAAAAAITASAAAALARRREEASTRRDARRRESLDRALTAARFAARERVLIARAGLLARVFGALEAALPALAAGAAYRAALPDDVARALAFTGAEPVVVRCAPALAPMLARAVKRNGRLTIHREAAITGFRVTTADGTLEVDGTLAGRVERLRPRLAIEALAALGVREGENA